MTQGQGLCYLPCPGNLSESCGGNAPAPKRALKKRQVQAGALLSLFANTAVAAGSSSPTSTNPTSISPLPANSTGPTSASLTSEAGVPTEATQAGSESGNSPTPTGSTNPSPSLGATGGVVGPFSNGTSTISSRPPTYLPIASSVTTPSTLFENGSSTTSLPSSTTKFHNPDITSSLGNSTSSKVSPGNTISSSSTGSQSLTSTPSSGTSGSVAVTGLLANPTNFVGFTITEM